MLRTVCLIALMVAFCCPAVETQQKAPKTQQRNAFVSYFKMPKVYENPLFLQRVKPVSALIEEKRYDQALAAIESMVQKCDLDTRIYLLGLKQTIYTKQVNAEKLIEAVKELKAALPDTGYMYFRFGAEVGLLNGWIAGGDFDNGTAQLQKMVEMFGTQVTEFEIYLAMVCTRMINAGKAEELDVFLQQLESRYPKGKIGYYVQSALFWREFKKKYFEGAEQRLQNICREFPNEQLAQDAKNVQQQIDFARKRQLDALKQGH